MGETFADTITRARYCWPSESSWEQVTDRVVEAVLGRVPCTNQLKQAARYYIGTKKFIPSGRILRNAGLERGQLSSCFLFDVEDTREGWGELAQKATVTLMTGGGIGANYSHLRCNGSLLRSSGGVASGPLPLIRSVNEIGRGVQCGGFRRSALYASLHWLHPDVMDFIRLKDWPEWLQERRRIDMDCPAPADMTNISVALDQRFFDAIEAGHGPMYDWANQVYNAVLTNMVRTGEPGFQIDLDGQILRNACTEIISADDSDSCVLGALNFARLELGELEEAVDVGTAFLLAVTEANVSPTQKCREVQQRNRRLGLEIMGIGEWFLQRGYPYGSHAIEPWLKLYRDASNRAAIDYAWMWGFPIPIARRALGPTGTISIIAETTSGMEPLLAPAYERRYLTPNGFCTQTLVDPVARRLYEAGQREIECAYDIDPRTRIQFQAYLQSFVDNGISSTINLPDTQMDPVEFGRTLWPYLSKLRGITVFPNGSRGLQPITPIPLEDALERTYQLEMQDNACPSGVCSI